VRRRSAVFYGFARVTRLRLINMSARSGNLPPSRPVLLDNRALHVWRSPSQDRQPG
jgi:hypothetical protein